MARVTQKMDRGRSIVARPASEHLSQMLWDLAEHLVGAAHDAKVEAVPPYVEAAQRLYDHLYDHAADDLQQEPGWEAEKQRLELRFLYSLCLSVQDE
ncbi:hypothetical protein [Sediminicoccus sp. KRV36]|uniref:hypothetical protein n=1 Tax=Sediminicoccus sp. KRV36 TaxID=3133721 RepID=UPI00200CE936|nr:hypothetical protein [Sediminicoccus rosea]UPY37029.1 hypothetical protein LHU95_22900 [Sediminicoccus rosea]